MLTAINLEGSNVTPAMDALRFDAVFGRRNSVLEGFGLTNNGINLGVNIGTAVIDGYMIYNNGLISTPVFPVSITETTAIMGLLVDMTPFSTLEVGTFWLTPAEVEEWRINADGYSLLSADVNKRKQFLPLAKCVGIGDETTQTSISSLEGYKSSYKYSIGGTGDRNRGYAGRVYPHAIAIGANTTPTQINVATTPNDVVSKDMETNWYYLDSSFKNPLGVKIRQTGLYRVHASSTLNYGTQLTAGRTVRLKAIVNKIGATMFQNPKRPAGSATVYSIATASTFQIIGGVDGSAVIALFEGDVLCVEFDSASPAYPVGTVAHNSRYEIEYLSDFSEMYQSGATY